MNSSVDRKEEPLISIIIPAYNERNYIAEALESIRKQTYGRYETIVIANGCTDDTAKIAREFQGKVVEVSQQGISHAKNTGFNNTQGEICAFMDADSVAKDDLLEKIYDAYIKGFECGKATIRPLDDPRFIAMFFCKYWEMCSKLTEKLPIDSGTGAFTFLTKDLGKRILNPDGTLYREDFQVMEDIEFAQRMKRGHGKWKFIDDSHLYASMRRFKEEGYWKCYFEDLIHSISPIGKTRKRWIQKT